MAAKHMPWLKWYPYLAQTSFRWKSLTLEERGLFHDLYDIAAMNHPRGELANSAGIIKDSELARHVGVSARKFGAMLGHILEGGLMVRTDAQVLVFPTFKAKQRKGPLRVRDGTGAKVGQTRGVNGALDVDEEVEGEVEGEKETTDERRERQATELVKRYRDNIRKSGPKADAIKNCAKLLKSVSFEELSQAVKNAVEDHKNFPVDYEYQANNFFGRKAYYVDVLAKNWEPRTQETHGSPSAPGRQGPPIHEGTFRGGTKVNNE